MTNTSIQGGPARLLKAINNRSGGFFAGNHVCRKILADLGYIQVGRRDGQWTVLTITPAGIDALQREAA